MSVRAQPPVNQADNSSALVQDAQIDSNVQVMQGLQYKMGHSGDYAQAFAWFMKAAQQGNPLGEYEIGQSYDIGQGAPKDDAPTPWVSCSIRHRRVR